MKPIRILAFLEASEVTGPAKNLLQFARMAREESSGVPIETNIAVFRRPGDSTAFLEAAASAGVTVHPISEKRRFDRSVLAGMRELASLLEPQIVQTHAVKSHMLARLSGLPTLAPWIAFHHGYTWPDLRARAYNQLDRWSLPAAKRIVTVSLPFRAELEKMGVPGSRISILHNAIDANWGREGSGAGRLRESLGIPGERKIILIVGRLSREKDHLTLLEALARMHKSGEGAAHLLIVGEGPERPRIEAKVTALGLQSHVTMTGQVPSAEPYYRLASLAVLSSRSEGSPNALLEAMAAHVPVVATSVGGIPEIVSDQRSALLVPAGNAEKLATAILRVLQNPGLADSLVKASAALVDLNHSPAARVRRLCDLYREMAAEQ